MKPHREPEAEPVIDTSKMSPGERAALELAEAAREPAIGNGGFAASLFMGRPDMASVSPFPAQTLEDRDQGDAFLERLTRFMNATVDPDAIDRDGEIPDEVIDGLARLGAFGIKIPARYGGLGLSQTNYSRAAMLLGSRCANITALLSAHQSIGVPQPLLTFGTEAQKRQFLPRCASGDISAFALTESGVGSDPAKMETVAIPSSDGSHYILDGEKLWCTNGTKAGLLVVMAKTPSAPGQRAPKISAFVVEMDSPGVEVIRRCHFMGLRALYNGVIRFTGVRVPAENLILGEGRGLKVALTTLNTGRITLPAACAGMAKRCLEWATDWARERVQWGAPIGRHDAVAQKLAAIAADAFAIESMTLYTSALVDRDKRADIRIEAAFGKMWGSEAAWRIVNETMQIRGGRGYETAASLAARGEPAIPVERFLRDSRINTIFEGSSEIMRLFIAREALDPHLKIAGAALNSQRPVRTRLRSALRSASFYALWYPGLWLPKFGRLGATHPALRKELRKARTLSRKLARGLFGTMLRHGTKLEKRQVLLGRFVDIGAELFAMSTSISHATHLLKADDLDPDESQTLIAKVRYFCKTSRHRITNLFTATRHNADREGHRLATALLK
jgi:alkylation response protein AidB-like acyl-CoA dehydrogenase